MPRYQCTKVSMWRLDSHSILAVLFVLTAVLSFVYPLCTNHAIDPARKDEENVSQTDVSGDCALYAPRRRRRSTKTHSFIHRLHHQTQSLLCPYINSEECSNGQIFLDMYYCGPLKLVKPISWIIFILLACTLFTLLIRTSDGFFCPVLKKVVETFKINQELAGLTILALGNGAPDFFTTVFVITHTNSFDIIYGSLFGGGLFITTIVVGGVLLTQKCITTNKFVFLRNIAFYVIALLLILFIFLTGTFQIWKAIILLAYYAIYVIVAFSINCCVSADREDNIITATDQVAPRLPSEDIGTGRSTIITLEEKMEFLSEPGISNILNMFPPVDLNHPSHSEIETEEQKDPHSTPTPTSTSSLIISPTTPTNAPEYPATTTITTAAAIHHKYFTFQSWWSWYQEKPGFDKVWIAVISTLTLPIHLSTPNITWNRYVAILCPITSSLLFIWSIGYFSARVNNFPVPLILTIVGSFFSLLVLLTTRFEKPPKYVLLFYLISFLSSVCWIFTIAYYLIQLLNSIGVILNIPTFILGITILAWVNCIGDLISDILIAKHGLPHMALVTTYAGPLFNTLLGLGIGFTVKTISIYPKTVPASPSHQMMFTIIYLIFILVLTALFAVFNKYQLPWWFAIFLFLLYVSFIIMSLLIFLHVLF